jgi:hypothetical protein
MLQHRQRARLFKTSPLLFCVALSAASTSYAGVARADDDDDDKIGRTHIGVDFDFNTALDTPNVETGGGGALRLGRQLNLLLIKLTPELGGGYHAFSGNGDPRVYSGFIGGRLGVGAVIEPSIYGHVGLAHVSGPASRTAPILDAGVALDFTLLPLIDLGLHAGYNAMLPRDNGSTLKFLTLGAQAALVF